MSHERTAWSIVDMPTLGDRVDLVVESVDPDLVELIERAARRSGIVLSRHDAPAVSFVCPRCGAESHNPNDVREGYCGRCNDWTGR